MSLPDLLVSQLTDPFRIGLLIMLFITMRRTRAVSGEMIPLAIGAVFVAVLLPLTIPSEVSQTDLAAVVAVRIGLGVVVNMILLAVIVAAWALYLRSKR